MSRIECLHHPPAGVARHAPPLVLVHGAYTGAWCWEETFLPFLAGHGFDCYALSLSGHAGSAGRNRLDHFGLADFEHDIAEVLAGLASPPVLIGHSMGGLLSQRLARHTRLAGLVMLASVPPYGLSGSVPFMMATAPHLLMQMNRYQWLHDLDALDLPLLRQLLFSGDTSSEHIERFAAGVQPESARALAELLLPQPWSLFGMPTDLPALVLGLTHDRVIAASDVWVTAKAWHVEPLWVDGPGHACMCDANWLAVAEPVLAWLEQRFGAVDG